MHTFLATFLATMRIWKPMLVILNARSCTGQLNVLFWVYLQTVSNSCLPNFSSARLARREDEEALEAEKRHEEEKRRRKKEKEARERRY